MPTVIGLTGSFGSGCSYFAEHVLAARDYELRSLSKVLEKRATAENAPFNHRREKQAFGDKIREKDGPDALAKPLIEEIGNGAGDKKWVIDSIRNPEEAHAFRKVFPNFYLFGIYADQDERWKRVQATYSKRQDEFEEDDENDTGRSSQSYGQRVEDCFYEADVSINNSDHIETVGNAAFEAYKGRVVRYIQLVENPRTGEQPRNAETLMSMAYAVSQRSSCLKRKVGAVIVDNTGTVVSSGFNEVPIFGNPCKDEYGKCYRTKLRSDLLKQASDANIIQDGHEDEFESILRQQVRMLDVCKALHAEENAIINLARNGTGVSLTNCTMYATTHPCQLCARKIAQLRLERVVYLEPYPDEEGKKILAKSCKTAPFEGVTSKAYFRLYGEKK